MKNGKLIKAAALFLVAIMLALPVFAAIPILDGQTSSSAEEIYPGVTATDYTLESGYKFSKNGVQTLRVLEFDPKQEDLAFDVVMAGSVGTNKTVSTIVDEFNKTNTENKKVIAAVNGDLWTMAQYHSRVEGSGTDDPVVKKELRVPRGTNISDGEIISSQNMPQETPYEEAFQSFGITSDGEPLIGDLTVGLTVANLTTGAKTFKAGGLNRLPANGTTVLYSDKGPVSNYCLDDAYEVVIDCDYDYKLCQNAVITGTVTSVSAPGSERPSMQENRLILTARGNAHITRLKKFSVGDEVSVTVSLTDSFGNTDKWQTVTEAVGGHCVVLRGGEDVNTGSDRSDPMTLIGFKPDGRVVVIVNDGRQPWHSVGINRTLFDELGSDLGLDSLFLLDGGGSTALVELTDMGYALKNRPSDGATESTPGVERAVINAVVISSVGANVPEYTVTWKCGDDVIYTESVAQGSAAKFDSEKYGIPRKAEDEVYKYEFAGWDKAPGEVNEDTVYSAVFEATRKYSVGDINKDGKVNALDSFVLRLILSGKGESTLLADVNADGKINAYDFIELKQIIAGK